jgi:hypothetical protein
MGALVLPINEKLPLGLGMRDARDIYNPRLGDFKRAIKIMTADSPLFKSTRARFLSRAAQARIDCFFLVDIIS